MYHDVPSFNSLVHNVSSRKDSMSVFHVNIRSLKNKQLEIDSFFESLDYNFNFMAFTETWFQNDQDVVHFSGYRSEGVYRSDRRGGGTSLYIKDGITYDVLGEFSGVTANYESVVVKSVGTVIASVYRPPSYDTKPFFEYITSLFEYVSSEMLPIVLVGDFNIDVLRNTPQSDQLLNLIESYSCGNIRQLELQD